MLIIIINVINSSFSPQIFQTYDSNLLYIFKNCNDFKSGMLYQDLLKPYLFILFCLMNKTYTEIHLVKTV